MGLTTEEWLPIMNADQRRRTGGRALALALGAVFVVVPLLLCAWVWLVARLVGAPGSTITADQVLAWICAALVGLVLFPLAITANRRWLSHAARQPLSAPISWGGEPTPPPQAPPSTVWARLARAALVLLGAVGVLAICGPLEVSAAVWGVVSQAGAGPRSRGAFFQSAATLTLAVALVAIMAVEALTARGPAAARRARWTWYYAICVAWVQSTAFGLGIAWCVLRFL